MFEEDQTGDAVVIQEAHYYPFGMKMEGIVNSASMPSDANSWLYSGQELQADFGLETVRV